MELCRWGRARALNCTHGRGSFPVNWLSLTLSLSWRARVEVRASCACRTRVALAWLIRMSTTFTFLALPASSPAFP